MAIVNTVKTVSAQAVPTEYISLVAQNVPINAATPFTLTGFVNYVRSGRLRVKLTSAPASSQITAISITVTDGTTTYIVYQDAVARTAATLFDLLIPFISELNVNSITITLTAANAGTASTADFEIAGNS